MGGRVQELFQPSNDVPPMPGQDWQDQDFLLGLQALQDIVAKAKQDGKSVRAYGSKWSLNNIAYNNTYLVESWGLNYCKVGIDTADHVTDAYQETRNRLTFFQSGVFVKSVNQALLQNGLALKTSGASDGQRMVGAISTGTHGSANQVGAMQEYVKAVHLVILDEHVLIQRASDAVVTEAYAEFLGGARLITDDALFNSAVVSFGSFGLIHGMLIEATPLYKLKLQSKQFDYPKIQDVITSLDVSQLGFEDVDELPYHLEISVNPYRRGVGENGAFVRIFQKIPLTSEELASLYFSGLEVMEAHQEHDIHGAVGHGFDNGTLEDLAEEATADLGDRVHAWLYGVALNLALRSFFGIGEPPVIKYPGEFFTSTGSTDEKTSAPVPGTSVEIGVPRENVQAAIDTIFEITDQYPLAAPVAIRYVKPSRATMAFTRWEDLSATIELPGPWGRLFFKDSGEIHERIFDLLAERRDEIPHSYHWGQQMPINKEWVPLVYGDSLEAWKEQRRDLLGEAGLKTFSNELIENLGIAD